MKPEGFTYLVPKLAICHFCYQEKMCVEIFSIRIDWHPICQDCINKAFEEPGEDDNG